MGKGLIDPDTAALRHQVFGVLRHLQGRRSRHHDVCRRAFDVLAAGGAAHCLVVGRGPVGGVDGHRRPKVVPDLLKQGHQIRVNEDLVGAVLAGELPDAEVRGQALLPVGLAAVCHHGPHHLPPICLAA